VLDDEEGCVAIDGLCRLILLTDHNVLKIVLSGPE